MNTEIYIQVVTSICEGQNSYQRLTHGFLQRLILILHLVLLILNVYILIHQMVRIVCHTLLMQHHNSDAVRNVQINIPVHYKHVQPVMYLFFCFIQVHKQNIRTTYRHQINVGQTPKRHLVALTGFQYVTVLWKGLTMSRNHLCMVPINTSKTQFQIYVQQICFNAYILLERDIGYSVKLGSHASNKVPNCSHQLFTAASRNIGGGKNRKEGKGERNSNKYIQRILNATIKTSVVKP